MELELCGTMTGTKCMEGAVEGGMKCGTKGRATEGCGEGSTEAWLEGNVEGWLTDEATAELKYNKKHKQTFCI